MNKSLEDFLYLACLAGDKEEVVQFLSKGANPNKTVSSGKTCLGAAASLGNIEVIRLLVDSSIANKATNVVKKQKGKLHKRKLKLDEQDDKQSGKCKNLGERNLASDCCGSSSKSNLCLENNQGYFVFIHNEGSSSDESRRSSLMSPRTPPSLVASPQELEWDEDVGSVAPTTSEDETWSSIYKWYAVILESTGAAIASASNVTNGIDQQDAFMRTALHYATEQGHTEAVKLLLDAECKIDMIAGDGQTALHVAVDKDNAGLVKMLLGAGSNVNYKTHEKMTPLHFAASKGFLDVVKILVNNGGHLEARDTNDRTPLYLAAGRGHADVVKYLISAGANVNAEEIHGYTPLCEAVWQRYVTVVEVLLAARARVTHSHKLLHNAVLQNQEGIVKMLAHVGCGINLHSDNGDTPLLLATRLSQPAIARILLQKGANVNSCNSITGATALHIAVESISCTETFEELLNLFLDFKIDMDAIALTGDTALNRALLMQKDQAALLLIRYGADVNVCDLHSCIVDNLSLASRRRSSSLAGVLLRAGHVYGARATGFGTRGARLPPASPGSTASCLDALGREPLALTDLTRIRLRNMAKNKVLPRYISSLPLPKSLKRYLMMEDEGL